MSSFDERHPKLTAAGKILGLATTVLVVGGFIVNFYSSLMDQIDRVDDLEMRVEVVEAENERLRQDLADEMTKRGLLIENFAGFLEEFERTDDPAQRELLVLRFKLEQARMECELSGKAFDSNTFGCNPARPPP